MKALSDYFLMVVFTLLLNGRVEVVKQYPGERPQRICKIFHKSQVFKNSFLEKRISWDSRILRRWPKNWEYERHGRL